MSGTTKEWVVFFSFFLFAAGATLAEVLWLSRKWRAGVGASVLFSVLTNLLGYSVGLFVLFVVFAVILGMAWSGSLSKSFPLGDAGIAATMIVAVLFVPTWLALMKRLFLSLFKIQSGRRAWAYSVASSILSVIISLGLPIALGYLLLR